MADSDMDILEFARRICMLSRPTPVADEFDRLHGQEQKRWWSCQREHLTAWCLCYPAGGTKGFSHTPSSSAAEMYRRFGRPETLLWLAEALGEDAALLQGLAARLAEYPPGQRQAQMKALREAIPFARILELLAAQPFD